MGIYRYDIGHFVKSFISALRFESTGGTLGNKVATSMDEGVPTSGVERLFSCLSHNGDKGVRDRPGRLSCYQ